MSSLSTIVIPTYNGLSLLKQHLASVEAALRSGDELLIVDDASTDETVPWLLKRFHAEPAQPVQSQANRVDPQLYVGTFSKGTVTGPAKVLQLATNGRFAKAVNTAVKTITTSTFLLLNNDVEPDSAVLTNLLQHFFDNKVFAVGCHEFENVERTIEGGKNLIWFERGVFQHARAGDFESGETAWVSGGSGMFDTNKWQTLGGFDEHFYPAYWEDTDLSFRARKQGWKTLFCKEAIVLHQHESSNTTEFGQLQIRKLSWQHQQYFTRKHASSWQLLQYYVWQPYWWWKMRT